MGFQGSWLALSFAIFLARKGSVFVEVDVSFKTSMIAAALLALAAGQHAHATGQPGDGGGGTYNASGGGGNSSATATGIGVGAGVGIGYGAGGAGGQGGQGGQATINVSPGGIGGTGTPISGTVTVRNVPSMGIGLGTAYCGNNAGGSVAGAGWGFNLFGSRHDEDCTRQKYGALLNEMGHPLAGILVMANNREVNAALTEEYKRIGQQPQPVARPAGLASVGDARRDPSPSRSDCQRMSRVRDMSQAQRDYYVAKCAA